MELLKLQFLRIFLIRPMSNKWQAMLGWKTAEISREGYRTDYDYDSYGRLLRTTLAEGQVTRLVYDGQGRMSETRPDQSIMTYQYDAMSTEFDLPNSLVRGLPLIPLSIAIIK